MYFDYNLLQNNNELSKTISNPLPISTFSNGKPFESFDINLFSNS